MNINKILTTLLGMALYLPLAASSVSSNQALVVGNNFRNICEHLEYSSFDTISQLSKACRELLQQTHEQDPLILPNGDKLVAYINTLLEKAPAEDHAHLSVINKLTWLAIRSHAPWKAISKLTRKSVEYRNNFLNDFINLSNANMQVNTHAHSLENLYQEITHGNLNHLDTRQLIAQHEQQHKDLKLKLAAQALESQQTLKDWRPYGICFKFELLSGKCHQSPFLRKNLSLLQEDKALNIFQAPQVFEKYPFSDHNNPTFICSDLGYLQSLQHLDTTAWHNIIDKDLELVGHRVMALEKGPERSATEKQLLAAYDQRINYLRATINDNSSSQAQHQQLENVKKNRQRFISMCADATHVPWENALRTGEGDITISICEYLTFPALKALSCLSKEWASHMASIVKNKDNNLTLCFGENLVAYTKALLDKNSADDPTCQSAINTLKKLALRSYNPHQIFLNAFCWYNKESDRVCDIHCDKNQNCSLSLHHLIHDLDVVAHKLNGRKMQLEVLQQGIADGSLIAEDHVNIIGLLEQEITNFTQQQQTKLEQLKPTLTQWRPYGLLLKIAHMVQRNRTGIESTFVNTLNQPRPKLNLCFAPQISSSHPEIQPQNPLFISSNLSYLQTLHDLNTEEWDSGVDNTIEQLQKYICTLESGPARWPLEDQLIAAYDQRIKHLQQRIDAYSNDVRKQLASIQDNRTAFILDCASTVSASQSTNSAAKNRIAQLDTMLPLAGNNRDAAYGLYGIRYAMQKSYRLQSEQLIKESSAKFDKKHPGSLALYKLLREHIYIPSLTSDKKKFVAWVFDSLVTCEDKLLSPKDAETILNYQNLIDWYDHQINERLDDDLKQKMVQRLECLNKTFAELKSQQVNTAI